MAITATCPTSCAQRPRPTPPLPWPRRAVRVAAAAGLLLVGLPVLIAVAPSPRLRRRFTSWWSGRFLSTLGVHVSIRGTLRPVIGHRGVLVVANHVSWLDPVVLNAVQPVRLVAKSEVRTWPLIGWLAGLAGTIWVTRRSLRTLPATVAAVREALAAGASVAVFPEATTTCGRRLGRFHPAMFQAAVDADASVQPVALRYLEADGSTSPAAAYVGDVSFLAAIVAVAARPHLTVEVHLLDPVGAVGPGPRRRQQLARSAREAMRRVTLPAAGPICPDIDPGALAS